jgi:hypothetical protein
MNPTTHPGSPPTAAAAARPSATVDDRQAEEFRRGHGDGMVWASDYATADELRALVANFEPGRSGDFDTDHSLCNFSTDKHQTDAVTLPHHDNQYWQGFAAGAEEILDAGRVPSACR